jgi:hypothetical protein
MITTTDTKVIIEFEHPCPDEVVKDIQLALISTLQHRSYDTYMDLKEIQESNFFLLELFKHTL